MSVSSIIDHCSDLFAVTNFGQFFQMTFMWRYHMCVLSQLASGHGASAHRVSNRVYSLMVNCLVRSIINDMM